MLVRWEPLGGVDLRLCSWRVVSRAEREQPRKKESSKEAMASQLGMLVKQEPLNQFVYEENGLDGGEGGLYIVCE